MNTRAARRPCILPATLGPRRTRQARGALGQPCVTIGGDAPVRVQSMTNTDTVDVIGTAIQVKELAQAGSELVRITVNTPEAAEAVPHIREQLDRMGIDVPLIGDFHYNGHRLLTEYPAMAQALSKYRINPGNVGKGDKRDRQFAQMIEAAMRHDKVVRIGVNWGSLDQELLAALMDENAARAEPWDAKQVMYQALVQVGAELGRLCARAGPEPRPDHHQLQGQRRAGPDHRLPRAGRALRLRAAPGPDRGRHGHQGHGGLGRGAVGAAAGGHRRHHPRQPDAAARRGAHAGGGDRAGDPAVAGPAQLQPQRHRLPGLRPHHQHDLPGAGQADRRLPARADAGVEDALPRRREPEGRGDGLHRQRPRREQACRHRHQPARHRRGAGGAGVHRRREGADAARRGHRRRVPPDRRGLHRARFGTPRRSAFGAPRRGRRWRPGEAGSAAAARQVSHEHHHPWQNPSRPSKA